MFDTNNIDEVKESDLIKAIIVKILKLIKQGEMNQGRRNIITQVFNLFAQDENGSVPIQTIKDTFDASKHPSVIRRKKTEDEVQNEFLDTFDDYYYYLVNKILFINLH